MRMMNERKSWRSNVDVGGGPGALSRGPPGGSLGQTAPGAELTPLVGRVLSTPHPVTGSDSRVHLVYELMLSNATGDTVEVQSIDVLDAQRAHLITTIGSGEISRRLSLGGARGQERTALGAAQFGVAFLHVTLAAGQPTPARLDHRVHVRMETAKRVTFTLGGSLVASTPPRVLGPPLRGKAYIAGDGCCDSIRHVRALLPLDGSFTLAQRFAIDWEQVDENRRLVHGDTRDPKNYTIFGRQVLSVADATVVAARNDLPEQVPGALPAGLPISEADGNFVVLDLGDGAFALFAHMQPGSVSVSKGDTVKRGQVIGRVGNTGNSQAPHLHFHVMDGPDALLSNGLPYVIDAFSVIAIDFGGH